jgi:hypothetical protein
MMNAVAVSSSHLRRTLRTGASHAGVVERFDHSPRHAVEHRSALGIVIHFSDGRRPKVQGGLCLFRHLFKRIQSAVGVRRNGPELLCEFTEPLATDRAGFKVSDDMANKQQFESGLVGLVSMDSAFQLLKSFDKMFSFHGGTSFVGWVDEVRSVSAFRFVGLSVEVSPPFRRCIVVRRLRRCHLRQLAVLKTAIYVNGFYLNVRTLTVNLSSLIKQLGTGASAFIGCWHHVLQRMSAGFAVARGA